jgi:hypothetical protein
VSCSAPTARPRQFVRGQSVQERAHFVRRHQRRVGQTFDEFLQPYRPTATANSRQPLKKPGFSKKPGFWNKNLFLAAA